jgi:[acyl-carrier-protein] S-malonyltransferase
MTDASLKFDRMLQTVVFQPAKVFVISNVEPSLTTEAKMLQNRLMQQMTGKMRWREIVNSLVDNKIDKVVEIGPGLVLTNMILKMYPNLQVDNISSNTAVTAFPKKSLLSYSK